jgi:hypothetical protein
MQRADVVKPSAKIHRRQIRGQVLSIGAVLLLPLGHITTPAVVVGRYGWDSFGAKTRRNVVSRHNVGPAWIPSLAQMNKQYRVFNVWKDKVRWLVSWTRSVRMLEGRVSG